MWESCDDHNTIRNDGCNQYCHLEAIQERPSNLTVSNTSNTSWMSKQFSWDAVRISLFPGERQYASIRVYEVRTSAGGIPTKEFAGGGLFENSPGVITFPEEGSYVWEIRIVAVEATTQQVLRWSTTVDGPSFGVIQTRPD